MSVTSYIADFLKEHNRVVVPGFGEFYLKNSKAVVDEQTKSILPPAKEVGFKIDYQATDEQLIHYISQNSNIAASEAEAELNKLTGYWKKHLAESQELSIEGLGRFHQAENDLEFLGNRIGKTTPDFYGLEEIDLKHLKSSKSEVNSNEDYKFNKSILWVFLLILPVLGLLFLAFTQRERLFGKKSFDDLSVQTSTHRIKVDSAKIQQQKLQQLKLDSLKQDSIIKDSIAKQAALAYKKPVKKYNSKNYTSKQWRKSKKRANR